MAAYAVCVRLRRAPEGPAAAGGAPGTAPGTAPGAGPAGVSVEQLLCAFYQPVFDLARLVQASAVEASLDAAADVAEGRDRWRLCCELPTLLEKLWADLYELRRACPRGSGGRERRARAAPAALVEGCLHVHARLDEAAAAVEAGLAARFVGRLVALHLRAAWTGVLSNDAARAGAIVARWARGDAREALALYFEGQIREGWAGWADRALPGFSVVSANGQAAVEYKRKSGDGTQHVHGEHSAGGADVCGRG